MVNTIIYDYNGEPIEFDNELSPKADSDASSYLEQMCNAATRSKKGIPNLIFASK